MATIRRTAFATGNHKCHAEHCNVPVPPRFLMCSYHWGKVPKHIRDEVWRQYRPGQEVDKKPSEAYMKVYKEAVNAVAHAEGFR